MTADEKLFLEENVELPPGLFNKRSMGSITIPPQLNSAKEWVLSKRESLRPWQEFGNYNRASKPGNISVISRRVAHNVTYYYTNYAFISTLLVVYCIISSPLLLLAITVSGTACYLLSTQKEGKTLQIGGHTFTPKDQAVVCACISLPLLFFASAGTVIFWVIGLTCSVVGVHASMMQLPNEDGSEFEMNESV